MTNIISNAIKAFRINSATGKLEDAYVKAELNHLRAPTKETDELRKAVFDVMQKVKSRNGARDVFLKRVDISESLVRLKAYGILDDTDIAAVLKSEGIH